MVLHVWCKNVSIISFVVVSIHTFDRETDRRTDEQTERPWLLAACYGKRT